MSSPLVAVAVVVRVVFCGSSFGGAQLLPIWPAVSSTEPASFPFWSGCGRVRRSRWSYGMQCSECRSSRGVGPDTCLVISHADRIAINESTSRKRRLARDAVVLKQTKVAKGSFVEVWDGERCNRDRDDDATRRRRCTVVFDTSSSFSVQFEIRKLPVWSPLRGPQEPT